jgi:hypothetical protein
MLNHTREAAQLAGNRTRADLDTDRVLSLALVRLLEIVGEWNGSSRFRASRRAA